MVIVAHDHRGTAGGAGFLNHGAGESLVDGNVAVLPGVMDAGVHVGVVGRVPHIVLQEPEQRVAEDVEILMVNPAGGDDVAELDLVAGQGRVKGRASAVVGDYAVAFAHCAGNPGKRGGLGQGVQGRYDAAAAPARFGATVGSHLMLHGAAVACQYQGAAGQYIFAQLIKVSHVFPSRRPRPVKPLTPRPVFLPIHWLEMAFAFGVLKRIFVVLC